jgi:hypothetical protein
LRSRVSAEGGNIGGRSEGRLLLNEGDDVSVRTGSFKRARSDVVDAIELILDKPNEVSWDSRAGPTRW